ncbi:hypothetical protein BJY59DRAFT_693342 [Rhodotorula toruloides]
MIPRRLRARRPSKLTLAFVQATFLATVSVAQAVDQLAKDVKIEHVKFDKANETGAARAREADAAWLPVFLCRAQTPALWRTRSEHQ